jgi:hypothetical protein
MIIIPIRQGDALLDVDAVARVLGLTVSAVNQRSYGHSSNLPNPLTPEHAAELVFPGDNLVLALHREWLAEILRRAGGRKPMRLWLRSAVLESDPKASTNVA